jgi:hypothetical protein
MQVNGTPYQGNNIIFPQGNVIVKKIYIYDRHFMGRTIVFRRRAEMES